MKNLLFLILALVSVTLFAADSLTVIVTPEAKQSIKETFLGEGLSVVSFIVYYAWGLIGLTINLLGEVIKRTPSSTTSPEKFSIMYWFGDNWKRCLMSLILIPVFIIFTQELLGMELSNFKAFFLGFSADFLVEIMKRKNMLVGGTPAAAQPSDDNAKAAN